MYKYLKVCVPESQGIGLNLASSITIDMCKLEEIVGMNIIIQVSFSTKLIIFPRDIPENRFAEL